MTVFYKMRGKDVDCSTITYREWIVNGTPDVNGSQYIGTKCGANALADITVVDNWNDGSGDTTSINSFGADSSGSTDSTAAITAAFSAFSDVTYLPGTYLISQSTTLGGSGKTHIFNRGAKIKVAANMTVTISGQINAAVDSQIFDTTANNSKIVLVGGNSIIYPEWFGAKGDGGHAIGTDNTHAVQAAVNAVSLGGPSVIQFLNRTYRFLSGITIPNAITLRGAGRPAGGISSNANLTSTLIHDFDGDFITFTGSSGTVLSVGGGIENLRITQDFGGVSDQIPRGRAVVFAGADATHNSEWWRVANVTIEEGNWSPWTWTIDVQGDASGGINNVRISEFNSHTGIGSLGSIRLSKVNGAKLLDCELHDVNGIILITGPTMNLASVAIDIVGGDGVGIEMDYASQVSVTGGQYSWITNTSNTFGQNYIHPGLLVTPFIDKSSDGQTVCVYSEPLAQVNANVHAVTPLLVDAGKYLQTSHTPPSYSVTGATNATPIVVTTSVEHGRVSGELIYISGVLGNTAANGWFYVTPLTPTTFSLQNQSGKNVSGNGTYSGAGTVTCPFPRLAVRDATNTSPIVIEVSTTHGLTTGAQVSIAGVLGNTNANGTHFIHVVDGTHVSLDSTTGNGTYTSGTGTLSRTSISLIGASSVGGTDTAHIIPNADVPLTLSASGGKLGVLGATPIVRQTLTGSRPSGAAVASLATALATFGFCTDSTTDDIVSASTNPVTIDHATRTVIWTGGISTVLHDIAGGVNGQIIHIILVTHTGTTGSDPAAMDRSGSLGSGFLLINSTNVKTANDNAVVRMRFNGTYWEQIDLNDRAVG